MYIAVIQNREFPIVSGSGSWKQNEIGKMDIFVPAQLVDGLNLYLDDITIYRDGEEYWTGTVVDFTATKGDGSVRLTQINAVDPLGYLMNESYSKTQAHYRDVPLTVIVEDLLSVAGWRLRNTDSMADRLIKTTIDLTKKETTWAQVIEAVKAVPDCYLRYAGISGGFSYLDLGMFDYPTQGIISREVLIKPLKFDRRGKMPLRFIKPSAGSSSIPISLEYALDAQSGLATDPDFPILIDSQGNYIVRNNGVPAGRSISKHFGDIKTTVSNPGDLSPEELQAELEQAALALYQRVVREFLDSRPQLNVTAVCAMGTIPFVPSSWRVISDATEYQFNFAESKIDAKRVAEFNQIMATAEVSLSFSSAGWNQDVVTGRKILYEQMTIKFNETGLATERSDLILAKRIDENSDETIPATVVNLNSSSAPAVVNQTGVASDAIHSTGVLAKQFSFALPIPPVGATRVYATVAVTMPEEADDEGILIDIATRPALPATGLLVYVTAPFRQAWTSSANVTLTAQFYFVVS